MWLVQVLLVCLFVGARCWDELEFFENLEHLNSTRAGEPSTCELKLIKYWKNFNKTGCMSDWACRMFDATAKVPSGFYELNFYDFGSFDECLAIDDPKDDMKGKYCLASIPLPKNTMSSKSSSFSPANSKAAPAGFQFLWAICVPDGCSASEIGQYFPKKMIFTEKFCQSESSKPELTTGDKLAIAFFAVILALIISSTAYDVYVQKRKQTPIPLLLAFSFLTNGKKLLTVSDDPNQIKCIGGIRAISMMWIVLGHMYFCYILAPNKNLATVLSFFYSNDSMFIKGATVSVDTFFLLSGIVMIYVFMKTKTDGMCFNVPMYYLHRYLRLTPSLAIVILIHVTLLKHIGSGPVWPNSEDFMITQCREYWWSALLYIQNWVNPFKTCVGVAWYLSVDMQLFILSPLILIPLKRFTRITLGAVLVLACFSIGSSFYVAWKYKLNAFISSDAEAYNVKYYAATHTRAAPWLIGVVAGYFIHEIKFKKIDVKLNKFVVIFLWMASLAILCTCVFAGNDLMTTEYSNKALNSSYLAFVRPAWALALAWVVFACILGYGGIINDFLSLSIFQVIARVSYSVYLIHLTVLTTILFSSKTPPRFSNFTVLYTFWGNFTVILGISIIWTLAFESPIIIIEKKLLGNSRSAEKPPITIEKQDSPNNIQCDT